MKKEYNLKSTVWIHMGQPKLVEGRVVDITNLEHLDEGHSKDDVLYIIEIHTGIQDIYEVRPYELISPDSAGPISLFRDAEKRKEAVYGNRYMKGVGVRIPATQDPLIDIAESIIEDLEPTPDQIHAALERSQQAVQHEPLLAVKKPKPKYAKRRTKKA